MLREFLSLEDIKTDRVTIDDKEVVHHARDVLRLEPGAEVIVVSARQEEYLCALEQIAKTMILRVKQRRRAVENASSVIWLACAVPKKAKFDDIVDKLTQLGITGIIPILTQRTVVKIEKSKKTPKLERWKKIALNASNQSQRSCLPVIEPIKDFQEVLSRSGDFDLKLIPTLGENTRPLAEIVKDAPFKKALVLIGPEGDFSPEEVRSAIDQGFIPVSLGQTVLRVDTACIAVTSFMKISRPR